MTWTISTAALSAPRQPRYDGGGPWNPSGCASGKTAEARALEAKIRRAFPWVRVVGGLRCERLQSSTGPQLSIHAVGRALDVMVPTLGAPEGDALANWLVANAKILGVQLVIWNGTVWQGSLGRQDVYTGPNSHADHVHVEVLRGSGLSALAGLGIAVAAIGAGAAVVWLAGRSSRRRR